MNEGQKEGSHTKNKVYRSLSARWTGNRPFPPPFLLHYTACKLHMATVYTTRIATQSTEIRENMSAANDNAVPVLYSNTTVCIQHLWSDRACQ
jgi:hypothetical protein